MPRKTNTELITDLMEHAASGPLMQAVIIDALVKHADACADLPAERFDTPGLNGFAWKRCLIELRARLTAHLDPVPQDADYIEPIREITRERFDEMLDILPPQKWTGCGSSQSSFHISERITDNVVCWLVRRGRRYFELQDLVTLTPLDLQERARAYIDANPEAPK